VDVAEIARFARVAASKSYFRWFTREHGWPLTEGVGWTGTDRTDGGRVPGGGGRQKSWQKSEQDPRRPEERTVLTCDLHLDVA
jgi:hypothetical protein